MKLVVAIVHNDDARALANALRDNNIPSTLSSTTGGFLREGNSTFLIGVEASKLDDVFALIKKSCITRTQLVNPMPPVMEPGEFYMPYPVEVTFGGATVFVLDIARHERL